MPLVFKPDTRTWKCENPTQEEIDELLELGKAQVLEGFSRAFIETLLNNMKEEVAEAEANKTFGGLTSDSVN